jgi:hypothetical protein
MSDVNQNPAVKPPVASGNQGNPPTTDGTLNLQAPVVKEQKEAMPVPQSEKVPIVELKEPQPSKEVASWIEKLEKGEEVQLPQTVVDDWGQVLVQSAAPQQPKITLPLDDNQLISGLKQAITNSIRWLAEWCLRLLKMSPERVEYKK